ncbi:MULTISPECIES: hypothetical protein [Lysobacter]|uniref:AbiU2 domain-containing protein n=1 Tax=Lysobacter TaxID=68 RepID=UPI001F4254B6|nr:MULTISPECIES: hypothetical protein [Lysobacter]UJB19227.1 hypothetical protein L1A79_23430 [Lysobacter capsici]UJQ27048.1 hypothetical protein L2D09_16455 [Lysobacter gummosus]
MVSTLGLPAVENLWRTIHYEVTWLHGRWAIYRQLYGTTPERVDILNRAAGTFAFMLQDVLLDDVQLGLSKLGDPPTSLGTKKNLTLSRLCNEVVATGNLTTELPPLLAAYNKACAQAKKRRNRRIAHFDLNTMLRPKASLSGPSRQEIEVALNALRAFMNCIAVHLTGTQTAYELVALGNDGDSLIATLKRGLRYQELVKTGAIPFDDIDSAFGTL